MQWPVLLMAIELDQGGSERQLAETARALDRSKFQPHVGCLRPKGMRAEELKAAGVPVVQFPVHSFLSASAISGAWQLARYIRAHNIRLVHTFDIPLTAFAVPVARFLTSAAVLSSQRCHRDLIPPSYLRVIRMTDRVVDKIVVNCEFVRRHLEQDEHVPAERIEVCHNGIDLDVFRAGESPRPSLLPAGAFVIGVVCVLRPEKDLSTLLQAFARVRHLRSEMKLAIVGGGPLLEPLQGEARALGIFDDCVFANSTRQVTGWLHAIDIFVLPSLSEALSNSLMEAMACGCCSVASDVGGNPELIAHGERGLLFEKGNADSLTAALEQLIQNDSLRRKLASNGCEFLHSNFSIQTAAKRMGDIYSKILSER